MPQMICSQLPDPLDAGGHGLARGERVGGVDDAVRLHGGDLRVAPEPAHLRRGQLGAVAFERGPVHATRLEALAALLLGELVRHALDRVVEHDDVAAWDDVVATVAPGRQRRTGEDGETGKQHSDSWNGANPHQGLPNVSQTKVARLPRFVALLKGQTL